MSLFQLVKKIVQFSLYREYITHICGYVVYREVFIEYKSIPWMSIVTIQHLSLLEIARYLTERSQTCFHWKLINRNRLPMWINLNVVLIHHIIGLLQGRHPCTLPLMVGDVPATAPRPCSPGNDSNSGYHSATGFLGLSNISNQWSRPIPKKRGPTATQPISSLLPTLKIENVLIKFGLCNTLAIHCIM
jgi:hypothetical protein